MKITKNTKTINLNLVFKTEILSEVKNDINQLREKVITIWGAETDPIITQFPEVVAVHLPQKQFSMIVERNRVIIVNQEVKPFESRKDEIEKMLKFADVFTTSISATLDMFGFNYVVEFNHESKTKIKKVINDCYSIKALSKLGLKKKSDIINAGLNITYKTNGENNTIKLTPINNFPKKLLAEINIHFDKSALLPFDEFMKKYEEGYNNIVSNIEKLLK